MEDLSLFSHFPSSPISLLMILLRMLALAGEGIPRIVGVVGVDGGHIGPGALGVGELVEELG